MSHFQTAIEYGRRIDALRDLMVSRVNLDARLDGRSRPTRAQRRAARREAREIIRRRST